MRDALSFRALRADERTLPATRRTRTLPLVIEPTTRAASLCEALSSTALSLLEESGGALLFRGWRVETAAQFAAAVAALPSHRLVEDYFPAEPGRTPLGQPGEPLGAVWPTNSRRRTGAYLTPEVLPHSENFYALQPPRLVCFWCDRAPWLGGETALFDASGALAALPPPLRARLSQSFAVRRLVPLRRLLRRHGIDEAALRRLLSRRRGRGGVGLRRVRGAIEVSFNKPAVVGCAERRALCLNFGECGARGRRALFAQLLRRGMFRGWRWAAHRALWRLALRRGWLRRVLLVADQLPRWCDWPALLFRRLRPRSVAAGADNAAAPCGRERHGHRRRARPARRPTLGESLSDSQAEQLGRALAEGASLFRWARGDVLLIDNQRVMHDGMPGAGPRRLRVALAGALALPQSAAHRRFLDELEACKANPSVAD